MKRFYIILFIAFLFIQVKSDAQGCVAIRSNGNTCSLGKPGEAKGWQFNFNNRYFKSYKHFVGKEEQHERVEEWNRSDQLFVCNWDFTFDKSAEQPLVSCIQSSDYFLMYDPPCMSIMAITTVQAGARRNTESFGIGDIRVAAYRWLFDPEKSHKGNLQAGLGIKLRNR